MSTQKIDQNALLHTEKTSEFIRAIIHIGYTPKQTKKGGSHITYEITGKPSITIVDGGHKTLSIGVRRQLVKLIFA